MDAAYDLVIRGGTVATATESFRADVGIRGETVAALGAGLPPGREEIDARGRWVLPGGVDSHCHIEQMNSNGLMCADTFESATGAAALGGTTTVIPFAAQHVGMRLARVLDEYHALARRGAVVDYALHMIVADPTEATLAEDIPAAVRSGHASIKVFMTYDRLRLHDEQLLDVLQAARDSRAMVCVHAENHGMISWFSKRLLAAGLAEPRYHAPSHPRLSETEAFRRLIALAAFVDQPIMIFHVSTAQGAQIIRQARGEGLKVWGETCPQYLEFDASCLDRPGLEGAKWMFSPPPRTPNDAEALWAALERGDLQTVSSDHAPAAFDATGKLHAGPAPHFKQIANGVPGLEQRLPLLFDRMVSKGRMGVEKFVELTATAPAKLYGLHPRKGSIAVGADADIAVWDPERRVTFRDEDVHDLTRYTPYAGTTVTGWPEVVLLRGRPVARDRRLLAPPGTGRFLPRAAGPAAEPTGRRPSEWTALGG